MPWASSLALVYLSELLQLCQFSCFFHICFVEHTFIWCLIYPRCCNDEYCAHYRMSDWWTCLMGRHPRALMYNAATVEGRSSIRRFTFLKKNHDHSVPENWWSSNQRTNSPTVFRKCLEKLHFGPFGHWIVWFFKKYIFLSIITSTIFSESPLLMIQIVCRCFPESLTPDQWVLHWCASLWFVLLPPTQPSPNVICYYRNNQMAELPAEMKNLTKLRSIILNYNRYGSVSTGLRH